METALNVASFVFVSTLLFGLALLAYGVWNYWDRHRFALRSPSSEPLPTRALDEARRALEKLRSRFFRASGARCTRLGHEVQRLEIRIQHLQQHTNEDQALYYQLYRRREKAWRLWKQAFDRMDSLHRRERKAARGELTDLVMRFREADALVRDEWHRAIARDELNLQELQTQGVLATESTAQDEDSAAAEEFPDEASSAEGAAETPSQITARPTEEHSPAAAERAPAPAPERPARAAEAAKSGVAQGGAPPANEAPPAGPTAVMRQADFAIPDLPKAGLRYADPEFSMAGLPGEMLSDVNLRGASFAGVRLTGVQSFKRCDLGGLDFRGGMLPRAEQPHQFVECDLTGVNFAHAQMEYALFLRCNLSYSQWEGAQLNRVKFAECRIAGARWDGADLSRTVMTPDVLSQGDFSQVLQPPHAPAPSPYDARKPAGSAPRPEAPEATAGPGGFAQGAELPAGEGSDALPTAAATPAQPVDAQAPTPHEET